MIQGVGSERGRQSWFVGVVGVVLFWGGGVVWGGARILRVPCGDVASGYRHSIRM